VFVADARDERRRRGTKAVEPTVDTGDKREQILQAAQ
jgi:hypothetical protein